MSGNEAFPLRYVVLRHEGVTTPHYDLLFETKAGSELEAYRVDRWPLNSEPSLERMPPHRRVYLTFEGPISGGRGYVNRVAAGLCRVSLSGKQRLLQFDNANFQWAVLLPVPSPVVLDGRG